MTEEELGCIMLFIAFAIVLGPSCIWLIIEYIKDHIER